MPGKYIIKFLTRDDDTGRIGTYQTAFTIPNLNKEEKRVPISSVVLGSQRVNIADALYNAQKGRNLAKQSAANPLIVNNQKLIPSVTRVFSKGRALFVYLQGYEQGEAAGEPLIGYVSLYKDGIKRLDTRPIAITPAPGTRLISMPMSFTVDLGQLPEGEYDCQVTVLAPKSGRSQFWRGPMNIVP